MKHLTWILFLVSTVTFAQTDSVIVSGRIRHLTPAMYRQSPQVAISRNNVLQASRELIRPAQLAPDGSFRVSVPLIFPYEEMYFNFNNITTGFLASAGNVMIELDADSLFSSAVPFRFKGANAAVNQQYARYKAFEAGYKSKMDSKSLSRQASGMKDKELYNLLMTTNWEPLAGFMKQERPLPLLNTWLMNVARYNTAAFMYEKAAAEFGNITVTLDDSLRPANDKILTAARANATNRYADMLESKIRNSITNSQTGGLGVDQLAAILRVYTPDLTVTELTRLNDIETKKTARTVDIRFFEQLMRRNSDTLSRIINYEAWVNRADKFLTSKDSLMLQYMAAYWVANTLPEFTLATADLLHQYSAPKIRYPLWQASLEELYYIQVKDRDRIEKAISRIKGKRVLTSTEMETGILVTTDNLAGAGVILGEVINANRGKVIYLLAWDPNEELGRQMAIEAQRLKAMYNPRDFALLYVAPAEDGMKRFVPEFMARYKLQGDHLLMTNTQYESAMIELQSISTTTAAIISPTGKFVKRNAPLPDKPAEIDALLKKAVSKK